MEWGLWSVKCKVYSKEWGVGCVKRGLWSLRFGVWSVKCKVQSGMYGVGNGDCGV